MKPNQLMMGATLSILLCICFANTSFSQHEMINIGRKADIWDQAKPQPFFKIPELRSKDGKLEVHLYISEEVYLFNGDSIKMRTYTYEYEGDKFKTNRRPNNQIGPWGPTLRMGKNDRLTVIIHNRLPESIDENYLCSIPTSYTNQMNGEGEKDVEGDYELDSTFKEVIQQASIIYGSADSLNDTLITLANLEGAFVNTILKDSSWVIVGRVPCPCPPSEKGTCKKIYIDYPVYLDYNYGTETNALRIYQEMDHTDDDGEHDHNTPHGFSRTNLHMHGFHVSPYQDDIFRNVDPTYSSYYTYDLVDHTTGTMWYHPHIHGSTSIQVASGMSGAVIIEDEFGPDDKALKMATMPAHERILIFNQLAYDTIIGETPDFETLERSQGPKGTTVNGVSVPIMEIQPGEVQRWRMVHAGYRSAVALQFPEEATVYQISVDGILFEKPRQIWSLHMAPGNRSDILIQFPDTISVPSKFAVESVNYVANCEYFPHLDTCIWNEENTIQEDFMQVFVSGIPMEMEIPESLPDNGHETIIEDELVNKDKEPRPTVFFVGTDSLIDPSGATVFAVNGAQYDGAEIPDTLVVGDAEQWLISSDGGAHPYHIHVNPFQVQEFDGEPLLEPMWKDVVMVDATNSALVYARYEVYWGDFVLHCHILAHEDEGMMQRVRIIRPEDMPK